MASSFKSLPDYVRAYRGLLLSGVALVLVHSGLSLSLPFCIRFAIDDLNRGLLDSRRLALYLGLFSGGTLLAAAFGLWMRRLPIYAGHRVERDIRDDLFAHLTELDPGFFQREHTGDLMTRMSSDVSFVREFIGQGALQISRTAIVFAIAFPIMFTISVRLALTLAILLPLISLVMFALLRAVRPRYEARQEAFSELSNFTQENFAGIRTVKGYAIEDRRSRVFRDLNHDFVRTNMRLSRVERPIWPLMMFLFSIGTVLILTVGGRLVIAGEITLGELVQFNQYMLYMAWPIIALGWAGNLCVRGLSSWRRLRRILDTLPLIVDGDAPGPIAGDIEFRGVHLALAGRTILDNINLRIPEGTALGITGPTGSGKTLLASLIPRLLEPTRGQVLIGGTNVADVSLRSLRRAIGVAQQEPFLFSDTLRGNINFGLGETDEETTHWAADVAQLTAEVELFPKGFDTLLGERGVTLSGGQRQRTAISRAVARDPSILILDDVLSAVDTQTEAEILSRLREVVRERTSLIVSHRVSALRHADTIVVIENGRILQQGSHAELLAQPGYYRELEEIQRLEAELEATS